MGIGYGFKCKKCGTSKNLFLGVGFFHYRDNLETDNFARLVEMGEESKILNLKELKDFVKLEGTKLEDGYGNEEYICEKCSFIDCKFHYELTNGKEKFTPKYKCKYCDGELRLKEIEEDFKVKCDNCGSTDFETRPMMLHWD